MWPVAVDLDPKAFARGARGPAQLRVRLNLQRLAKWRVCETAPREPTALHQTRPSDLFLIACWSSVWRTGVAAGPSSSIGRSGSAQPIDTSGDVSGERNIAGQIACGASDRRARPRTSVSP
jgi:hypothetical protein